LELKNKERERTLAEDITQILKEDHVNEQILKEKLEVLRKQSDSNSFYSDLFRVLANLELEEPIAQDYWKKILYNADQMSECIKRPVGFRVALLDYLVNENKLLKHPKIIELNIYEDIVRNTVIDELTGIYNRRYFNQVLTRELNRGKRYARVTSLFLFDIDDFKEYNDTFGHQEGDKVLKFVGETLKFSFRSEDIVCRVGGEEFAVILPEIDTKSCSLAAKRFTDELSKNSKEAIAKPVTISGGIANFPQHGNSIDEIFACADTALYEAKRSGKNRVLECKPFS
ncbi:MAG: GGDEF domain-containing protein, partial [Leptospira sp.]|nr:GGDEF domain-containing protein [Leptospira sp.]